MMERGYSRDTEQCRTKIKELRQTYQKAREVNRHSESQPQTCRFYHELHAVMGGDATTTPPLSVDTCKGGVARSEEDELLEDEEEEEEEEEDSAQVASGESVFPSSKELFLTLDPIASPYSQCRLLDHDPGEGTSALEYRSNTPAYELPCTNLHGLPLREFGAIGTDLKSAKSTGAFSFISAQCTVTKQEMGKAAVMYQVRG
ncbi:hypothetical protein UY3_02657 [Chelonia mydas]|uniref:Myb/SANT-like DNA-binding domain-containing protein n=1 Tax=Chelonia mydas TaxID=8469 RepID=M7BQ77_CHEMY|nr:hypothetical protein UY3_02657 [Chelonia mydas]